MKKLLIISPFLFCSLMANELKWVDEQIKAIKPARSGISKAKINSIKSPFIFLNAQKTTKSVAIASSVNTLATASKATIQKKTTVKKSSKILVLEMIINKSARINGKWYRINDKIGKYTFQTIDRKNVILSYKKKELVLSTVSKNKKLNFKSN